MVSSPSDAAPMRPREEARFEVFLRERKLKLTGERMAILAAVFQRASHFDAESLHAELKGAGADISRATVYRTLDLLVQCGLVRKHSLGATHASYEAAQDEHHDHLVCIQCGKVLEFFRPDLEKLQESICRERDFQPFHHSLQIFGLCSRCKGGFDEKEIQGRVAQLHT
ncbi:Fur family transcriptional regulator [Holophaga foetida]|uniref:Fur family transcriptional regulator n=1 Tax=Holophaga foetida TaxID=35839 RepID=UPI0002474A45|nr:Fur family transcriptional regulator [Holophaga foetida]